MSVHTDLPALLSTTAHYSIHHALVSHSLTDEQLGCFQCLYYRFVLRAGLCYCVTFHLFGQNQCSLGEVLCHLLAVWCMSDLGLG